MRTATTRQPALRSGVQDGAGRAAFRPRSRVATDHLAAGEPGPTRAPCCAWGGPGRSLLRVLRAGAEADRARHRRHLRRRAWRPAIALFNAHYDEYGFQPIVVFRRRRAVRHRHAAAGQASERRGSTNASSPSAARDPGQLAQTREILIRADSHYCRPEVIDWCRANGLDFILGVAPTTTLRRIVVALEAERRRPCSKPRRRRPKCAASRSSSTAPQAGAASNASSRASKPARGRRHAASSSPISQGQRAPALRGRLLPARPGGESHQVLEDPSRRRPHLLHQGDRQPVPPVPACRRLLADVGLARRAKALHWRVAQFDTLRLRLIKIAARVVEMKTQIRLHLPTACPYQAILRIVLDRIPRLAT